MILAQEGGCVRKGQIVGASVMVLGGISPYGLSPLVLWKRNGTLESASNRSAADFHGKMPTSVFKQDFACTHRFLFTRDLLNRRGVRTIQWTSRSTGFNIIEKLRGVMACQVYTRQIKLGNSRTILKMCGKLLAGAFYWSCARAIFNDCLYYWKEQGTRKMIILNLCFWIL